MFKRLCCCLLLYCFAFTANAATTLIKTDTLLKFFKLQDQKTKVKALTGYLTNVFSITPIPDLTAAKTQTHQLFVKYNVECAATLDYFIESICRQRMGDADSSEIYLTKAAQQSRKTNNHFLIYSMYSRLGLLQTSKGNIIDAINNYRIAKKEAIIAKDPDLQIVIDINISDIYYKNNLCLQSLPYLNEAQMLAEGPPVNQKAENIVYFNKAEAFFRMGNIDSLKKYNALINDGKRGDYKLYIYKNRIGYFLSILQKDYKSAVTHISALKTDKLYRYDNSDELCLSNAYYEANILDSAKATAIRLLAKPDQNNHPETKYRLYEELGEIAQKQNDPKLASVNFKLALQQLKDHVGRLTQVGLISSEMKVDEKQSLYESIFERQQLWLIFAITVAILAVTVVAMSYQNAKQKRYYEQLLFNAKKEELSFINSHEVRRHLSNILGIIDVIKHSENKQEDYLQTEKFLLDSAECLDNAIKNIADKLDN